MVTYTDLLNEAARKSPLLKELTTEEQKRLKSVLLSIYDDLASFCEIHNLSLFLVGGSCLGSVRHLGYIPWDDDLDVALPRKDYNELISLIERGEFSSDYEFSYPSKEHDSKNLFLKIFKKGTRNVEIHDLGSSFPKGISIDVFPMENVPKSSFSRHFKSYVFEILSLVSTSVLYYNNKNDMYLSFVQSNKTLERMHRMRGVIGWFFAWIGHGRLAYWTDRCAQCEKDDSGLVTFPTGRKHYNGEILPKEVFLPLSKGIFESRSVNLPNMPDSYLTNLYGSDYMTIPPEHKRERHFVVEFKG